MIWLVLWLCGIAFGFQAMFTGYLKPDNAGEWFFTAILYVIVCCACGVICILIAGGLGFAFSNKPLPAFSQKLAVIRDKDGVQGQFFLGSGFIQSNPYYFYYVDLGDGGLRPGKVEADDAVTVIQEDRADAELVTVNWVGKFPAWAWIVCLPTDDVRRSSYSFRVPRGTIKTGYSM